MKFNTIVKSVKNAGSKAAFAIKKSSPELALVGSIALSVGAFALTIHGTLKAEKDIEEPMAEISRVKKSIKSNEVSKKEGTTQLTKAYGRAAWVVFRDFAPAVACEGGSIALRCYGHVEQKNRLIGVSAALAAKIKELNDYRNRVAERFGEDVEHQIRYNLSPDEVEKETINEKGKKKKTKEEILLADFEANGVTQFKFSRDTSLKATGNLETDLFNLRNWQSEFNADLCTEAFGVLTGSRIMQAMGMLDKMDKETYKKMANCAFIRTETPSEFSGCINMHLPSYLELLKMIDKETGEPIDYIPFTLEWDTTNMLVDL